ncbi:MAG: hypothetical protein KA063_01270 [Firmicutes bacterium]|nr:hypothetical protein [Bacillota bacterium]
MRSVRDSALTGRITVSYSAPTVDGPCPGITCAGAICSAYSRRPGCRSPSSIYDVRHTHATLLARKDIPPKDTPERLGHSGTGITTDLCAHALEEGRDAASAAIGTNQSRACENTARTAKKRSAHRWAREP